MLKATTSVTASGSNTATSVSISHLTTSVASVSNARATNRYEPMSVAAIASRSFWISAARSRFDR